MRIPFHVPQFWCSLAAAVVVVLAAGTALSSAEPEEPKLRLRASPQVTFAGDQVLFIAELRDGDDDYRELYCVTVEWDWDDGTRSESTPDCDPYEPGVSKIRRRYSTRHTFRDGGRHEVRVFFKQRDDVIASVKQAIEVRLR